MNDVIFQENLESLDQHGFLLIEHALDDETVKAWREILYDLYEKEKYEKLPKDLKKIQNYILERI